MVSDTGKSQIVEKQGRVIAGVNARNWIGHQCGIHRFFKILKSWFLRYIFPRNIALVSILG